MPCSEERAQLLGGRDTTVRPETLAPGEERTMSEIRVYGASDDLLEFEGAVCEEFDNPKGKFEVTLVSKDSSEALMVVAWYTMAGTWSLGVAPTDEDFPLPPWPISLRRGADGECGYSATLVIEAPDGVQIKDSCDA